MTETKITGERERGGGAPGASPSRERRAAGRRRPRGLRDLVRIAHRYIGLVAGLVLVVTGLTGSALVFRSEIDAALDPHLLRVAPGPSRAPLEPMLARVRREHPADPVARVRMPTRPTATLEFWMGAAPVRYVYADPYTGAVLGGRAPTDFLTGWLFLLHSHLLSGEHGHTVAGIAGLLVIALSISGIVIWWPRRAPWAAWTQWRAALTVTRRGGAKRFTFDLHRALGFYASVLLLVAGVTGASLVFHEQFERLAHLVAGTRPSVVTLARAAETAPGTSLPLDSLIAIAEEVQPGGFISYLYLPTKPGETFRVRKRLPGEQHPNGKSFVHLEAATGRVLAVEDGSRAPRGARLYSLLYPLHIGIMGGLATRGLLVLVGLSLPTLAVSGALVWWRRGRQRAS